MNYPNKPDHTQLFNGVYEGEHGAILYARRLGRWAAQFPDSEFKSMANGLYSGEYVRFLVSGGGAVCLDAAEFTREVQKGRNDHKNRALLHMQAQSKGGGTLQGI